MSHNNRVCVPNKEIEKMKKESEKDNLHHFDLNTHDHNFKEMFGNVKFVITSGSERRVKVFADKLSNMLKLEKHYSGNYDNWTHESERFTMRKIGPILLVNHGMGIPSLSIVLHEVSKLLHYAECTDVVLLRVGTSGGIGKPTGTVVVTTEALNGLLKPYYIQHILGKEVLVPSALDKEVASDLLSCSSPNDNFEVVAGKTMTTDDFYEGQARLDGATCKLTQEDKLAFLTELQKIGVVNIEMEATVLAAMCKQMNIKGAVVCVTIVNRMLGDQIVGFDHTWVDRPLEIVARYIQKRLLESGVQV